MICVRPAGRAPACHYDGDNDECTLTDLAAAKDAIYTVGVNFTVKKAV
jgi:hypothetical protein